MMRAPPAWERTKTNENYWSHALLQHLAALACYPAFIATVFKVSYYANACVQTRQHTHTYTHTRSYTYEYADISIKAHINYLPCSLCIRLSLQFISFHFAYFKAVVCLLAQFSRNIMQPGVRLSEFAQQQLTLWKYLLCTCLCVCVCGEDMQIFFKLIKSKKISCSWCVKQVN